MSENASCSKAQSFVPHYTKASDAKSVWSHYLVAGDKREMAKCKKCNKILQTKGGSTKGLHTHLKTHNLSIVSKRNQLDELPEQVPCKQLKIGAFFPSTNHTTLEAILARMIAVDGFTFSAFVKSFDLRQLIISNGFQLPRSRETIRSMVLNYQKGIEKKVMEEIKKINTDGERFSLVFDEWTSILNKHFLNINVFSKSKFWNLGLVRYRRSMTAEVCVEKLPERLLHFQLNLDKDIVAITTDGASTMIKVGKLIEPYQQLCFAHGLQLAIIDVLYKAQLRPTTLNEADCDETDDDFEDLDEDDGLVIYNTSVAVKCTEKYDLSSIITKVRKIVKTFRKSPTKNDLLQQYVKTEHSKELKLILDCKTRWSSLLDMLQRLTLLEKSIKKATIDLKINYIHSSETNVIKEVVSVLQPIKVTIEALCSRDMNLHKCDVVLQLMLEEIKQCKSSLFTQIIERIKERRTIMSSVFSFLTNPNNIYELKYDFCNMPSLKTITKEIETLLLKLQSEPACEENLNECTQTVPNVNEKESFKEKLYNLLNQSTQISSNRTAYKLSGVLVKEVEIFCNGGDRSHYLQMAYDYLLTVQPTSVEAERCFSSAGFVCNKFRSKLEDSTLNALLFLRTHFKCNDNN